MLIININRGPFRHSICVLYDTDCSKRICKHQLHVSLSPMCFIFDINPGTITESLNYAVYKYVFLVNIDFVFKYGVISLKTY